MILTYNDGKSKRQSWEARLGDLDEFAERLCADCIGYGESQEEAVLALQASISALQVSASECLRKIAAVDFTRTRPVISAL